MRFLRPDRAPLAEQLSPVRNKFLYVTLLAFLGVGYGLKAVNIVSGFSRVALDAAMSTNSLPDPSICRLVTADTQTLIDTFEGKIPIDPTKLYESIGILDKFGPAVIALDFYTDAPAYQKLTVPQTNATIVWVQGYHKENGYGAVAGRRNTAPGPVGSPVFELENDTIRRYIQYFDSRPTFARAIVDAYCLKRAESDKRCEELKETDKKDYDYLRHFNDNTARSLSLFRKGLISPESREYKGKVIILGGEYGEDYHQTSIGKMTGARLNADAVESILAPPLRDLPATWEWGLKITVGFIVALVYRNVMTIPAAVILLLLVAFSIAGSIYLLRVFGYWPNLALFTLGIWIEQLYESHHTAQHDLERLFRRDSPVGR